MWPSNFRGYDKKRRYLIECAQHVSGITFINNVISDRHKKTTFGTTLDSIYILVLVSEISPWYYAKTMFLCDGLHSFLTDTKQNILGFPTDVKTFLDFWLI